jgi:hypothetical protein
MRLKHPLILAFAISMSLQGISQQMEFMVRPGKEFAAPRNSTLEDIIGYDATGIYTIKGRYRGMLLGGKSNTLEHFNNEFEGTKSFDLEIKENGNNCEVEEILQLNNKLYIFYSYANNGSKKNWLFVKEIDKGSLQPKGESKKLAEIDFAGKSNSNNGEFDFKVSRDSSRILVSYHLPYDKSESQKIGFNVLDDNMNSLWENNVTLPYQDKLFDIETYKIDNAGNVYLLGVIYSEKRKNKRNGLPNYRYEVIAFRNKAETMVQYPIALEDKFLTDMQIEILDNNRLVCAGFYSQKGTYSIKGTYFLSMDAATKEIKTKSFKEFSLDFIIQSMSDRDVNRTVRKQGNGAEPELYEYDLDKLLIGKDGSAILIGEQYFVNAITTTSYMNGVATTRTIYHYYYNDIIAVKINPEGQIMWAEKIAKSQHTIDDNGFYASYTLAIVRGKICFIFNDNPKNVTYQGIGRPARYNGVESVAMIVSLNQQGEQVRQPLFKNNRDIITRPKVCKQIANNEVILFGQRKKNQQFARLVFE